MNKISVYDNKSYLSAGDLAMWLELLSKGNAVYISEPLSYLRLHKEQNSAQLDVNILGVIEWVDLINSCYENNILVDEKEYKEVLQLWLIRHIEIFNSILKGKIQDKRLILKTKEYFTNVIKYLLETK